MRKKYLVLAVAGVLALGACGEDDPQDIAETAASIDGDDCAAALEYAMSGGYYTPSQSAAYSLACGMNF